MKRILRLLACLVVSVAYGGVAGGVQVAPPEGEERQVPEEPPYAAGRLMVKLTPKAQEEMELLGVGTETLPASHLPVEPLRELSRQHQVTGWKRLFHSTGKKKKEKDPAGLDRVYLLTCDPDADILAAVRDFSALTELIEYAEPDYLAEIQGD